MLPVGAVQEWWAGRWGGIGDVSEGRKMREDT